MGSLFSRRSAHHLDLEVLTALALIGPDGAPDAAEHARVCPDCAERLRALQTIVADDRDSTVAEADQVFTPARLARQQAGIARRLGRTSAAGRVLWFPGAAAAAVPHRHVLRRSVAAAALIGLLVGAAAGRLLDPHGRGTPAAARDASPPALAEPAEQLSASAGADEAFLRDFEAAVLESRLAPLQTLDALTPHEADLQPGR